MQNNRIIKKKFKIILPMVLSMILLVTFIYYWLNNQFYNEKNFLQKDLSQLCREIRTDGEFILFYKNVIQPALNYKDSTNLDQLKIGKERISSFAKKNYVNELKAFVDTSDTYKLLFQIIDKNTLIPDSLRKNKYYEISRIGYKYNIHSSRIYYQNKKNSSDTTQLFLKQLLLKKLKYNYPGIKIKKEESIERQGNVIVEKKDLRVITHPTGTVIYFENYFFYIIKLILPQLIFGIILISLSVFSLTFAYRNYLSQSKLNMLRSDFINNITHELKIPVATAQAAIEFILEFGINEDKEKTKSYLIMAASEMNRLNELTSRVLEHSKLESNRNLLHMENTFLNEFLDEIVKTVKLYYANKINIQLNRSNKKINISIDRVYIEGVIRNLIENSRKYGGNNVNITINLWQKGLYVFISVVDNGPGIPKEYLTKVFDRFFRVPTIDHHNIKGFGLGLSFAALVMKQHSGKITASNLPNKGCKIVLEFPTQV